MDLIIIFNYETHECLETWIRDWQELLKEKPENLIFSINFRNLVIHSNKRISKDNNDDLFDYSVPYLRNMVKNDNPAFGINPFIEKKTFIILELK